MQDPLTNAASRPLLNDVDADELLDELSDTSDHDDDDTLLEDKNTLPKLEQSDLTNRAEQIINKKFNNKTG